MYNSNYEAMTVMTAMILSVILNGSKLSVQSFRLWAHAPSREEPSAQKAPAAGGPQNVASITCLDTQSAQDVRCVL
jgi:hypothetical protein